MTTLSFLTGLREKLHLFSWPAAPVERTEDYRFSPVERALLDIMTVRRPIRPELPPGGPEELIPAVAIGILVLAFALGAVIAGHQIEYAVKMWLSSSSRAY